MTTIKELVEFLKRYDETLPIQLAIVEKEAFVVGKGEYDEAFRDEITLSKMDNFRIGKTEETEGKPVRIVISGEFDRKYGD